MISLTNQELLIGLIVVGLIVFLFWKKKQPDADGRYPDSAVNVEFVEQLLLKEFKLVRNEKLKLGYTEKTIEKQLESLFQSKIQHVVSQYGLDGASGQKIDFDLGRGEVGVEIKLAHAVFKAAGQDRMVGQIQSYIKSKYSDENLLLVIFCEAEHIAQRAIKKSIEERLEGMSVKVLFLEMKA